MAEELNRNFSLNFRWNHFYPYGYATVTSYLDTYSSYSEGYGLSSYSFSNKLEYVNGYHVDLFTGITGIQKEKNDYYYLYTVEKGITDYGKIGFNYNDYTNDYRAYGYIYPYDNVTLTGSYYSDNAYNGRLSYRVNNTISLFGGYRHNQNTNTIEAGLNVYLETGSRQRRRDISRQKGKEILWLE